MSLDQTAVRLSAELQAVLGEEPIDLARAALVVANMARSSGGKADSVQLAMVPQNYIKLEGKQAQQILKLMEALEDYDDTKNIWSNFDVDEKEIEASLA